MSIYSTACTAISPTSRATSPADRSNSFVTRSALLIAEASIVFLVWFADHWNASSSSVCLLGTESTEIDSITFAFFPSNWTNSLVTWLGLIVAETSLLILIVSTSHDATSTTTRSVFGEDVSVSSASAWVLIIRWTLTTAAVTEEATASFTIDMDIFSAESAIIMIATRASLPAHWTDSIMIASAAWIAEKTVLLLVTSTSVEWTSNTSSIGVFLALSSGILHARWARGPADWTNTIIAGFTWWIAEKTALL